MTPLGGLAGRRLLLVQGMVLLTFVLLGVQLLRVQILDPALPPEFSDGRATRIVEVEPPRGLIYDRHGVPLAENVPRFAVVIVPGQLPDDAGARQRVLMDLERAAGVAYPQLEAAVEAGLDSVDPYAPIAVRTGMETSEAIALQAALSDIGSARVQATAGRVYSDTPSLAHTLGYVGAITPEEIAGRLDQGYPFDAVVGRSGVELVYEDELRGDPGRRLIVADINGRELELLGEVQPRDGADIVLSIDQDLQRAAAEALRDGMDAGLTVVREGFDRPDPVPLGAAVVLDVDSGEVLSMVSLPSYDPNLFADPDDGGALTEVLEHPARPLINRAFQEVRSPGSIFKPLVALAALEEGVATADTRITSTGAITVQDQYDPDVTYTFKDWAAHGTLDLYGAIARSSDVYFYLLVGGYFENGQQVFEGLGPDTLARYALDAGLGSPTGIDLPGEVSGLVPNTEWKRKTIEDPWYLGDSYTFGIGQGYLTTTPLQMAVMTAAFANGGGVLQPRVVRAIQRDGEQRETPRRVTGRLPGSDEHIDIVRRGMREAAASGGTAETGQPASAAPIAGKTGTAEFGVPYPDGEFDTHGWYIGFAPYDDPEIAVAVYLEYGVGATHAGPVAREIFEAYFGDQASRAAYRGSEAGG